MSGDTAGAMAGPDRERFIPFRKADVVEMCLAGGELSTDEQQRFRQFCRILESLFHFEFHSRLERLKDCYRPFSHDSDVKAVRLAEEPDPDAARQALVDELTALLDDANFERVTRGELEQALTEESLLKLQLDVDFADYEELLLFRRGEHTRRESVKGLLGLRTREVTFTGYERVAVFVRLAGADHFEARGKSPRFPPGSTVLKLFQQVPAADLEMLLPNTEVRMRLLDKLLIGVPALVGGAVVAVTKLATALGLIAVLVGFWLGLRDEPVELDQGALVALLGGLAAVGGYITRQVNKFQKRKFEFMKDLSETLYFRNLDNELGVFHHLLDAAEEEECKEAFCAYAFLLTAEAPLSRRELDERIEAWLADRWGVSVDFEVADAVGKLVRVGVVSEEAGTLRPVGLDEATRRIDEIWDNLFQYNRPLAPGMVSG